MSKITTDDCKIFLMNLHAGTKKEGWKRIRKYKGASGEVLRDFEYTDGRQAVLEETAMGLKESQRSPGVIIPQVACAVSLPLPKLKAQANSSSNLLDELRQALIGGGATTNLASATDEEKFLNVIRNGIDWGASEGHRSAWDFSKNIDFQLFVQNCKANQINLLEEYINYMEVKTSFIFDIDETEMPYYIESTDYDDSYPDMRATLEKIIQGYQKNKMAVHLNGVTVQNIISNAHSSQNMMDCDGAEVDESDCLDQIEKMEQLLMGYVSAASRPTSGL